MKTTVALPDNTNQQIVYTNSYGEPMLDVFVSGSNNWENFTKYDPLGRVILTANPSALTGYDDRQADLLNSQGGTYYYMNNAGLVRVFDYFSSPNTAGESTAGGVAFAKADGHAVDPAQFQQRIEKRVDRALTGTDATAEQKKQVADIVGQAFKDMRGFHDQRMANRKAMQDALQAPTIDAAKIEGIRAEQMKIADASSQRFTKALTDAGKVLTQAQRQAFFKNWEANHGRGEHHHKRG